MGNPNQRTGSSSSSSKCASSSSSSRNTNNQSLPDVGHGIYATDEYRMYSCKVEECPSSNVDHDPRRCPYWHLSSDKRRDPKKYRYTSQLCPFSPCCYKGDECGRAHGDYERGLHPHFYRTALCNSSRSCKRPLCFYAHSKAELRLPPKPASPSAIHEEMIREGFEPAPSPHPESSTAHVMPRKSPRTSSSASKNPTEELSRNVRSLQSQPSSRADSSQPSTTTSSNVKYRRFSDLFLPPSEPKTSDQSQKQKKCIRSSSETDLSRRNDNHSLPQLQIRNPSPEKISPPKVRPTSPVDAPVLVSVSVPACSSEPEIFDQSHIQKQTLQSSSETDFCIPSRPISPTNSQVPRPASPPKPAVCDQSQQQSQCLQSSSITIFSPRNDNGFAWKNPFGFPSLETMSSIGIGPTNNQPSMPASTPKAALFNQSQQQTQSMQPSNNTYIPPRNSNGSPPWKNPFGIPVSRPKLGVIGRKQKPTTPFSSETFPPGNTDYRPTPLFPIGFTFPGETTPLRIGPNSSTSSHVPMPMPSSSSVRDGYSANNYSRYSPPPQPPLFNQHQYRPQQQRHNMHSNASFYPGNSNLSSSQIGIGGSSSVRGQPQRAVSSLSPLMRMPPPQETRGLYSSSYDPANPLANPRFEEEMRKRFEDLLK